MVADDWWSVWMQIIEPEVVEAKDRYRYGSGLYNTALEHILGGEIDLLNDTIRVVLADSSYTPTFSQQTIDEVSGYSYSAYGHADLEDKSFDTLGNFDAADVEFLSVTGDRQICGAVIYDENNSKLIAYTGFDPITPNGGNMYMSWHPGGILQAE